MHIAKKFLIALGAAALLAIIATPVNAQATGTTDVDIDFDPLLILYYYSEIDITVDAGELSDLITDATVTAGGTTNGVDHYQADEGTEAVTATASGADLTTTLTAPGSLAAGLTMNNVELTVINAWAVRGLGNGGGATYDIEVQRGDGVAAPADIDLVNGASTVTITDTKIRNNGSGTWTDEATGLNNSVPGLATPDLGDVRLDLDLTGLTLAGVHSSAASTDFTITATHL